MRYRQYTTVPRSRITRKCGKKRFYMSTSAGEEAARRHIREGMSRFRAGNIRNSVQSFDAAIEAHSPARYFLWQRGISLYYVDEFALSAEQFRIDVAQNPNDTEEAVWCFLAEARDPRLGFGKARERMLTVGEDPRHVMRKAYRVFAGDEREEKRLIELAEDHQSNRDDACIFYAKLYLGLYAEAKHSSSQAQFWITDAVRGQYANSGDYMTDVARVHCKVRGWSS